MVPQIPADNNLNIQNNINVIVKTYYEYWIVKQHSKQKIKTALQMKTNIKMLSI